MHRISVNILLLALLGIVFIAFYVNAEESNQQIELSLQDCISLALKSNLNIRIQNLNPQI